MAIRRLKNKAVNKLNNKHIITETEELVIYSKYSPEELTKKLMELKIGHSGLNNGNTCR